MARTQRVRRIVGNPPRRKRARNRAAARHRRRNLSPKQIKFFGTPAQKAALKRSRAAKRGAAKRIHKRHTRRNAARRTRRRNVGEIISLTLGNPSKARRSKARKGGKRGATTMAKAHRRRRRRAVNAGGHRRRRTVRARTHHRRRSTYRMNAGTHRRRRRTYNRRRHTRRNPGRIGGGFGGEIMDTLWMVGGAVGTKAITQMVLGANNTGLFGYAGNGVAGFALSFLFSKVFKMPAAGKAIFKGAILQIVLRAISDYTPFGQYTSQIGVGDYQVSNWVTPQIYLDPNNSAMVKVPAGWGAPALPAGKGMGAAPFVGNYTSTTGNYS